MDSREEISRVSVGTVKDWRRVEANYRQSIMARLEEQIRAQDLSSERDAIIAHANEYVNRALQMAQLNLRINGQHYETFEQAVNTNVEQFDEALDRRIWSLADTRLQWHKRIAEARRENPASVERMMIDLLAQQREEDGGFELDPDAEDVEAPVRTSAVYERVEEGLQKSLAAGEQLDQMISNQEERVRMANTLATDVKLVKSQ